jgi:hypothetical protein
MLVVIAIVIVFALVAQYNKNRVAREPETFTQPFDIRNTNPSISSNADPRSFSPAPATVPVTHDNFVQPISPPPAPSFTSQSSNEGKKTPAPYESVDTEMYLAVDYDPNANKKPASDSFPKGRTTTEDLLPKDASNSLWSQVNPAGQGDLQNVNLLDAGWNFGIDTKGQTLKNPNLQLRSEFPNPKKDVGPWGMSTIDNDCSRRYFEIGEP